MAEIQLKTMKFPGIEDTYTIPSTPEDVGAAAAGHTHSYAGSASAGGAATSANKLNTNAGDSNTPVYFSGGVPKACTSLDLNTTGSAAKLTTARTIQTNLSSTSSASFNGSANITPGVTGTLPIVHGGTNATTAAEARLNLGAASNPNLLDNWYFIDPVNQRGVTSLTSEGYFIDRWKFSVWSAVKPSVSLVDGYGVAIYCGCETGDTNTTKIMQVIDNPERFAGKTLTLSAKMNTVTSNGDARLVIYASGAEEHVGYTTVDGGADHSIISTSLTVPDDVTYLYVAIGNDANRGGDGGFYMQVESMKLEIGSVSTLANDAPPKKSEQLLECQRYYIRWSNTAKQQAFSGGAAGTAVYAAVQLPTAMRGTATPTVTYAELDIYNFVSNGAVAAKSCGCNMLGSRNSVVLWVTYDATSACPGQTPASIRIGENGYIALSCEI